MQSLSVHANPEFPLRLASQAAFEVTAEAFLESSLPVLAF